MQGRHRISGYFFGLAGASLSAFGCRAPTQITVEVTTEVPCDAKTKATTTIAVGSLGQDLEHKPPVVFTGECRQIDATTWRIGSLVLVPSGDRGAEIAIRVVTAIDKDPRDCEPDPVTKLAAKDCIIARRALRFVPHTELYLPVGMDVDCTGVPCDSTSTCVAGKCVSATIDDSAKCTTPDACGESALGNPAPGGDAGADGGDGGGTDAGLDADDGGDAGAGSWTKIAAAPDGRAYHLAAWTGKEMVIFGGGLRSSSGFTNTGARYDPKTDTWRAIEDAPLSGRRYGAMIATDAAEGEVIVFGGEGDLVDGARWNPKTDTWTAMAPFPLAGRADFMSVYIPVRNELIVWGGENLTGTEYADGARYSLASNTWTKMASNPFDPRNAAGIVWTGTKVVIYGGACPPIGYCADTLTWDPVTDVWATIAAAPIEPRTNVFGFATGASASAATFFGGGLFAASEARDDGATWDGTKWTTIPSVPTSVLPSAARVLPSVWASTSHLFFWGGRNAGVLRADGAAYDPSTRTWTALPALSIAPREAATVVWTGSSAIVFGGDTNPDISVEDEADDGAIFTP